MKKNGVTVIQASARLAGAGRLALDNGGTLSARHIILATGARARELPALPLGERIWAYRQALVPDAVPKSLLVVGAGAIGAEFASFYRAVGAEVTLIDMTAEILPQEDAEISQLARKSFEKQGIRVLTQCAVTASSPTATGVKVTLEQQGKRSELESSASSSPPASSATSRTWAWKARASRWKRATSSPTACAAPASRASTPSATWPARPGWRTRPAMKACCAWKPSPASRRTPSTRCAFPPAPTRTRKWPASA